MRIWMYIVVRRYKNNTRASIERYCRVGFLFPTRARCPPIADEFPNIIRTHTRALATRARPTRTASGWLIITRVHRCIGFSYNIIISNGATYFYFRPPPKCQTVLKSSHFIVIYYTHMSEIRFADTRRHYYTYIRKDVVRGKTRSWVRCALRIIIEEVIVFVGGWGKKNTSYLLFRAGFKIQIKRSGLLRIIDLGLNV